MKKIAKDISIYRSLFLLMLTFLMFQNIEAKHIIPIDKDQCEEKTLTVKTEFKSRYKYFFFRRTNHTKDKRTDKVVDENGNVILQITMKSTTEGDQYLFRKFHRVLIIEKEIHEAIYVLGKETGKIIVYNFCGEKIKEFEMEEYELLDKYRF